MIKTRKSKKKKRRRKHRCPTCNELCGCSLSMIECEHCDPDVYDSGYDDDYDDCFDDCFDDNL